MKIRSQNSNRNAVKKTAKNGKKKKLDDAGAIAGHCELIAFRRQEFEAAEWSWVH